MRKLAPLAAVVLGALALAATATAAPSQASAGSAVVALDGQKVVKGFFEGKTVRYLDLGEIKLAKGNKVAPIWVFTNGADGQRNIIDTVPGDDDYTPLWRVTMVTWKDGATPRVLRSAAAVKEAMADGDVTLKKTNIVVNCPVLGFGQKKVSGFVKGKSVQYLDLGPVKLKAGNKVEPIWAFKNGADGQRNIIDTVPGDDDYTPLWGVEMVEWKAGVTPRVLKSADEVEAAVAAGEATIEKTDIVVNCPVV